MALATEHEHTSYTSLLQFVAVVPAVLTPNLLRLIRGCIATASPCRSLLVCVRLHGYTPPESNALVTQFKPRTQDTRQEGSCFRWLCATVADTFQLMLNCRCRLVTDNSILYPVLIRGELEQTLSGQRAAYGRLR